MTIRKIIQQGDVLAVQLAKEPVGNLSRVPAKYGRFDLVMGEHTGNAHFLEDSPKIAVFVNDEGKKFIHALAPVELKHGHVGNGQVGHYARTILPGWYEIEQVREIDPFTDEIRTVAD